MDYDVRLMDMIHVILKMKGGSEEENGEEISIYAHNIQGLPNKLFKSNKEELVKNRMEPHDIAVFLETGVNNEQKIYPNGHDKFEAVVGNRMAPIKNERR